MTIPGTGEYMVDDSPVPLERYVPAGATLIKLFHAGEELIPIHSS
jgi:hypothetical protein